MAKSVRSRRVPLAAGALSVALLAPIVAVPEAPLLPAAAAQTADAFNTRYTTANFWNVQEAVVQGLTLDPGTTVVPTTNTIFNWNFRNDNGQLVLIRPKSNTAYKSGSQDIRVKVTPAGGKAYTTTLRVNVVDEDNGQNASVDKQKLDSRYTTANFWNQDEAAVEGLTLDPGTKLEPTTDTIFNWGFRNDDGQLVLIRPKSAAAFGTGAKDISVKVTESNGASYPATLKVTVVDARPRQEWEDQLAQTYKVDFENSNSPKTVSEIKLPQGVTLEKSGASLPTGWKVAVANGEVAVTPPSTFKKGYYELPVKVNDGTDTFDAQLKIFASNPQSTPQETADSAADIIGKLLGPILGSLIPGLGGAGNDGSGGKGLFDGLVKVEIQPSGIIVTGNGSNNGSNNSAVVTGNANPTVVITGNANPTVEIKDNGSNNGSNNSAVVTGNANPVITGNANPTVVITGNANPSNNGNNNGSNNGSNNTASVEITGNANPVITGNANPVITGNANPSVGGLLGGSSGRGGSSNRGNGNGGTGTGGAAEGDAGAGNAVPKGGVSSRGGSSLFDANVGVTGGVSDPRCIASLVGLGLPLLALVPLALAQQVKIPGLEQVSAQAAGAFNAAIAQFNIAPEQVTAVGGGIVGVVLALIAAAAAATCVPRVNDVDVRIGGRATVTETVKVEAPVVATESSA